MENFTLPKVRLRFYAASNFLFMERVMPTYLKTYFELLDLPLNLKANELIELMINRHISLFSFSSINVILNKPLSLEPEKLFERVIKLSFGGY